MDRPLIQELLGILRETDSVYAHGFANYYERIANASIGANLTGHALLTKVLRTKRRSERAGKEMLKLDAIDYLRVELLKFETIAVLAQELKREKYCKVDFNDTGVFVIKEGRCPSNFHIDVKNEVPNDTDLTEGLRIELLESPNGSGKTLYIKTRVWNALLALATGYTSAKSATMPVFPRVAYLDRVPSDLDRNLSAFGNEMTQWMALPIHFQVTPEAGWLIGVDEAGSSTDPHSQGGLSDALATEAVDNGNVVLFSSHHHDWVESFAARARRKAIVSHFAATVSKGKVTYDFAKRPGGAPSFGLEVIAAGRGAPEVSFVRAGAPVSSAERQPHRT